MWFDRSLAATFLPLAVTAAEPATLNDTSPLGVVTVRVLLAASNLDTVPVAVIIVAFAVFAGLAAAAFAGLAWANAGPERARTAAAMVRQRNIRIKPPVCKLPAFATQPFQGRRFGGASNHAR